MVQILNSQVLKQRAAHRVSRPGTVAERPSSKKSEARRLEILGAAARVFRRRGVAAAGMREIAEEAGLSSGNVYYYFRGKEELLFFCQDRTLEQMHAALLNARASGAPAAEQLRSVLWAHLHFTLDELQGATAHLELDALSAGSKRAILDKRDSYEHALRRLVQNGVRRGEFAKCDVALVTRAMLGAVNWSARWYRPDGPQSVAEIAEAMSGYLVSGLLKNAGSPAATAGARRGGTR